jgi:hypothetical protein
MGRVPRKVRRGTEGFRREGGARLPFDPERVNAEGAPDWEPAAPPTLQHVAAMASTPMRGPEFILALSGFNRCLTRTCAG